MEMQRLVASMLAQLAPEKHQTRANPKDLEEIIESLQRREDRLRERLSREETPTQRRHLITELEVAKLQHKKALSLRSGR